MALSGSYTFYGQNYSVDLVFSWTATQNISANTSTVSWKLYLTGSSSNGNGMFGIGTFKINNSTVYSVTRGQPELDSEEANRLTNLPLNTGIITSGTFTVNHDTSGAGSFKFEGTGDSPYYICFGPTPFQLEQGITGSQTFTLNPIARPSKVAATNANIGAATTITITRYVSSYTHTITYTFGSLTGTIATKDTRTSISWTVPTTFYAQIPNATTGTCTITCQTYSGNTLVGTSTATFKASIVNATCAPTLSPVVKDVNSTTIALTGNANKLIRFESLVEFQSGATARNNATLKTQSVVNGSITKTDFAIGTIEDPETPDFIFSATDSRGLTTTQTYTTDMVMYVKPTCYQEVRTELVGETGAKITLTINGNYFHGNFGTVNNTYTFAIRYAEANSEFGAWQELPAAMLPTLGDDNEYELTVEINNLEYNKSYKVQSYLRDKLNYVESSVYTVRVLPVFDWDKDDFNFNVPIHMNGETILRHNKEANNLVVAASGGSIYFRPGGTNSTSTEMRLNQNGDLVLNGTLLVDGVDIIQALKDANII